VGVYDVTSQHHVTVLTHHRASAARSYPSVQVMLDASRVVKRYWVKVDVVYLLGHMWYIIPTSIIILRQLFLNSKIDFT
jgi:hypothetical protein